MPTRPAGDQPRAWLVGFRLDPESAGEPDVYTVYIDADRPILSEQSIVFFASPSLAASALARDDDPQVRALVVPNQIEIVYDLPMALYRIADEDVDDEAIVVNLLNVLFDLVKAAGIPLNAAIKRVLYPFADHLTFNREFGAYLDEEPGRRHEVVDAVLWCIGAIMSHATLLRSSGRNATATRTERRSNRSA